MPRTTEEWIGKTPDTPVPPRVRLRVLTRYQRRCGNCCRFIGPGVKWTCDHRIALINGGRNWERNLWPLCEWCVPEKDAADVHEKSATYRKARKHAGIKMTKWRPLIGTIASGWKRYLDGRWERR